MNGPNHPEASARHRRRVVRNHERGGWLGMVLVLILCVLAAIKWTC